MKTKIKSKLKFYGYTVPIPMVLVRRPTRTAVRVVGEWFTALCRGYQVNIYRIHKLIITSTTRTSKILQVAKSYYAGFGTVSVAPATPISNHMALEPGTDDPISKVAKLLGLKGPTEQFEIWFQRLS